MRKYVDVLNYKMTSNDVCYQTIAALAAALFDAEEGTAGTSAQGKQEKFAETQATETPAQLSVPVNADMEGSSTNPNIGSVHDGTKKQSFQLILCETSRRYGDSALSASNRAWIYTGENSFTSILLD